MGGVGVGGGDKSHSYCVHAQNTAQRMWNKTLLRLCTTYCARMWNKESCHKRPCLWRPCPNTGIDSVLFLYVLRVEDSG